VYVCALDKIAVEATAVEVEATVTHRGARWITSASARIAPKRKSRRVATPESKGRRISTPESKGRRVATPESKGRGIPTPHVRNGAETLQADAIASEKKEIKRLERRRVKRTKKKAALSGVTVVTCQLLSPGSHDS
jgi:hypothetical protein